MITADTNVFVYLWDTRYPVKQQIAQTTYRFLAGHPESCLGLQVIGELQSVLCKKLKQPPFQVAQIARNFLTIFPTFPPSEQNALEALALMAAGRFSYWDALLVTAARDAGCRYFLSEDMSDGLTFGSLTIINPFAPDGPSEGLKTLMANYGS